MITNSEAIKELKHQVYKNTDNCEMKISKDCYKAITNALEENSKLKAEIEQLNGIISRDMDKHECYVISKSIEVNNLKIEIKQLKSELEQSVKLPCKVGDKLFSTENGYIEEFKVRSLNHIVNLVEFSRFDETVFFTREEAEQSLKGQVGK